MRVHFLLSLLALFLTQVTSAMMEAGEAAMIGVMSDQGPTDSGLASIPEKTTDAVVNLPRGPSITAEALTEMGTTALEWSASTALTSPARALSTISENKCIPDAPGCSKCIDCCVFRLRSHQWILPDTNVVVLPATSACVPVPIEGQYSLVTNECTHWFRNCTMWPQRDCTGAPYTRSLTVPRDVDTWFGTTFYIRAISCSPAERFVD